MHDITTVEALVATGDLIKDISFGLAFMTGNGGGRAPVSRGLSPRGPVPQGSVNRALAGKTHPKTGVKFNDIGFPDFSKHLFKGGKNNVIINPTGTRAGDFAAANRAAGYTSTPKGFTWHHHQQYGRMQLVNSRVDSATGHSGGFSIWGGG